MESQKMTIKEVLRVTIANLQEITIPVTASETVGTNICGCIRNLQMCIEAISREEAEKDKKKTITLHTADGETMEEEIDERDADAE